MADLLLKRCMYLVTNNGQEEELTGVDVRVSGNLVEDIGKNLPVKSGDEEIDCRGKLVIPGLINPHHHFFQTLQRNLPHIQNIGLFDWLVRLYDIWQYVDAEVVYYSSLLAMSELLKTGCTTTSDHHYLYPAGINGADIPAMQFKAAEKAGIRFSATRGSMSMGKDRGGLPPESVVQADETVLQETEEAIQKYHDPEFASMRQMHVAPCSPFNVTPQLLRESAKLARKYGVRLHTHLAETLDEERFCEEKFGRRPFDFMQDLGWTGADVWYAHGIYFNDAELDKIAESGIAVCHCPASNMRLGSGIARIRDMRDRGIPVGIGVDGSASNDSSDMLGELRLALLLQRVKYGAEAITARDVLFMGTKGSAAVLGREDLGTIEKDKPADIAIFDLDRLDYAGALADPLAAAIFCGDDHNAHMTIVNGEIVVRDRQLVNADEREITEHSNRLSFRLLKQAGVSVRYLPDYLK